MSSKLRGLTNTIEVLWRDSTATVLNLDDIEAIIFKSDIWNNQNLVKASYFRLGDLPIDFAPASKLFSTSSFTTEQRSKMT